MINSLKIILSSHLSKAPIRVCVWVITFLQIQLENWNISTMLLSKVAWEKEEIEVRIFGFTIT